MEITELYYNESDEGYSYAIVGGKRGVTRIEHSPELGQTAYTITYKDGSDKIIFNPNRVHRKPIRD